MSDIDFRGIAADLTRSADAVCRYLLPGGRRAGKEYIAPGGRSLSINLIKGNWKDFAGEGGADLINLWARERGCSNSEAALRADAWLRTGNEESFERNRPADRDDYRVRVGVPAPPAPQIEPLSEGEVDPYWWTKMTGSPTKVWRYDTVDGEPWAEVYRFDHPGVPGLKAVRPWDPKEQTWQVPKIAAHEKRPLYGLADILAAPHNQPIVITEGEKACDAVRELGVLATTNLGGAAALEMTDWTVLAGRNVIHWRDKDTAGRTQAHKLLDLLRAAEVASCRIVEHPRSAPAGHDAADYPEEERRALLEQAQHSRPVITSRPRLTLADWTSVRYAGAAPPRRYLVDGVIPIGCVSVIAGMGGLGKGLIALNLAYQVAFRAGAGGGMNFSGSGEAWVLGRRVLEGGAAVILAGEDDQGELHNRLSEMDPEGLREKRPGRLFLVPLPNAGGNYPLVRQSGKGTELTEELARLRDELASIPDLRLVILDPLSRFAAADVERNVDASQMLMGALGSIAAELGIAMIIMHHMVKPKTAKELVIKDKAGAREAIRGTGAIVDGSRLTYAFWPETDKSVVLEALSRVGQQVEGDEWRTAIVYGAVVKSNMPHDQQTRGFRRAKSGLLVYDPAIPTPDSPAEPESRATPPWAETFATALDVAARAGWPYSQTSIKKEAASHLPHPFSGWAQNVLAEAAEVCVSLGLLAHYRVGQATHYAKPGAGILTKSQDESRAKQAMAEHFQGSLDDVSWMETIGSVKKWRKAAALPEEKPDQPKRKRRGEHGARR